MNRNTIITAFFALVFFGGQCALAQSGYNLFQKGLVQERVKGDLDEAIKFYERIVVKFPENRPMVAKALLHIGLCYEKMGKQEAQKAYQRVIEEYPRQKQEVAIAKERIAKLSKALEEVAHKPTFRKINIASKPQNGVLSPDGNKLAFMSDDAVWVVPLHGKVHPDIAGEPVWLAELKGIWEASGMMAWSADGKWIAVYGQSDMETRPGSVCVIPVAGGKPRVVQLPKQGSHLWSYCLSLSPDGQILAFSALELGTRHEVPGSPDRYIYTIPTAGGEPKQVSLDWARMPSFSSDGEFIAYVGYRKREAWQRYRGISRFHGDLWVVPSAGGTPVKLATVDGRLRGPVWSPDGKYIAAHHEPRGTNDSNEIWVFPLSPDASSAGEPEKIALPHSSWRNILAGWTPDNELGVFISTEEQCAMYTVPASGGKAMQITLTDGPCYPRWSPDGERIYVRGRFDKEDKVPILYVPSEGGDPVQVPPVQLERRLVSRVPNGGHNVSPDGKRIVISTSNGIWTIPLDGGLPTRLTSGESFEGLYPCWSPNGRTIAFTEWNSKSEDEVFYTIYVILADGGEISQITSEADRVGGGAIAFSPDGERIAFFSGGAIKTIPIEGGQRQVLVTDVKSGRYNIFRQLAYSPDGSKIAHNAGGKIWITSLGGGESEELRTGLPENAKLIDFGWSPDGEKIAFIASIGGEEEFWLIENFLPESKTGE
ncbi:MAG: PD40 domain-containing protein [Planctomycetes bacterium]|nr:PD40 domain-containing protein [Planctomycetota bacterium]MBL7142927.1 PD40 domain-containing protein [Phycisphaerae bacterium]